MLFVYDGDRPSHFETAERIATPLRPRDRCDHGRGPDVPHRRRACDPRARRASLARSLDGYRAVLRAIRARLGVPVAAAGAAASPATPSVGAAVPRADRAVRRTATRSPRTTCARSGASRRASSRSGSRPGRTREFHLKLGQGRAHRRRVHGAAAPAPARRRASRGARAGHDRRLSRLVDAGCSTPRTPTCSRSRTGSASARATRATSSPARPATRSRRATTAPGRAAARLRASPQAELRDEYRRVTRRARKVVDRVFYGTEPSGEPLIATFALTRRTSRSIGHFRHTTADIFLMNRRRFCSRLLVVAAVPCSRPVSR